MYRKQFALHAFVFGPETDMSCAAISGHQTFALACFDIILSLTHIMHFLGVGAGANTCVLSGTLLCYAQVGYSSVPHRGVFLGVSLFSGLKNSGVKIAISLKFYEGRIGKVWSMFTEVNCQHIHFSYTWENKAAPDIDAAHCWLLH